MSKEFEIARILLINAARKADIARERGAAWAQRVYPLNPDRADEVFKDDFEVGESEVALVLREINAGSRAGEPISYRTLESRVNLDRPHLVAVCRCAHLEGRFDHEVWEALMKDAPLEARSITADFDADHDLNI